MMRKSIWTIYYLFLIISIVALTVAGWIKHQSLHQNLYAEQAGTLKIYSQSFQSRISEQELLLDVLGEKLLENELYLNQSKVHEFLKKLMKTKPSLADFRKQITRHR